MRYSLTGHLSAYKARRGILHIYLPCSSISQGFPKPSLIQLALQRQYSTDVHNTRKFTQIYVYSNDHCSRYTLIIHHSFTEGSSKRHVVASSKAPGAHSPAVRNEKWLEFDLNDVSIPENVRSAAWRIKVLDIANVVSHADAERLHRALREFHKAKGKLVDKKEGARQADIATRLAKIFEKVQVRAEKKFEAEAQRDVSQLTTEEANLRRDVALALDQLQNLQNVPQDTPEPPQQETLPISEPMAANESGEAVTVAESSEIQPSAAETAQAVRLKRFQSESTLAWIQGKKLQHAIAWAEENAQIKRKLTITVCLAQAFD